jgi:tRNA uridine 5-carbamoylmethylation protein Kti12
LPEGQDPSPSIAAFNKSFGTSHRGELLRVGREVTKNRYGTPRILTLWESPALIDETGEDGSDDSLEGIACISRKVAKSSQKNASASAGKSSSSSWKKVIMKNYSRQGLSLFSMTLDSRYFMISCL